jgi:hypothetical protein
MVDTAKITTIGSEAYAPEYGEAFVGVQHLSVSLRGHHYFWRAYRTIKACVGSPVYFDRKFNAMVMRRCAQITQCLEVCRYLQREHAERRLTFPANAAASPPAGVPDE